MAKLKNPLWSLDARNTLGGIVSFVRRRRQNIAEKKPVPPDAKTLAQLSWRHMYQKAVALWHALSAAEQQDWESQARSRHMTGFAWFMSQALKPNPGLYLPLQGGTMAGEIDMAKYRIRRLPHPAHTQDPLRVQEYTDDIAPYLYDEGARVYHSANQAIPHNTATILAFNSERYDTDSIHDLIVNNSRLTCQTAGKYLIILLPDWGGHVLGWRMAYVYLNGATKIAQTTVPVNIAEQVTDMPVPCIYALSVGDYVEAGVMHTATVPVNIQVIPNWSPEFMMQRIG